ncbi:MAG: hypothetical protein M1608_00710 [Candidatus Omnitrophica bacterium]|nr:hypothetical protein [Candidatus Omnitrophota bacterium]
MKNGLCFYAPCLDWKEFAPCYLGLFPAETRICESENYEIPTMLRLVFDHFHAILNN